jgi:hypothetical protein
MRCEHNIWCSQKLFATLPSQLTCGVCVGCSPNAVRQETARGPVWTIPENDVAGFVKPKRGRIPRLKPKSNGAAKKKGGKK